MLLHLNADSILPTWRSTQCAFLFPFYYVVALVILCQASNMSSQSFVRFFFYPFSSFVAVLDEVLADVDLQALLLVES